MAFFEHLLRKCFSILLDSASTWVLLLLVICLFKHLQKMSKLPPGPWGVPIAGIIPFIKKEFHLLLYDFSRVYGNIYSFKMGQQTYVVLSDLDLIKKAFRSRDFVSRPKSELSSILGGYGKIFF